MDMVKQGYKQTEIGVIPEDWEVKELGEVLLSNPDYGINAAAVNYDDTLPTYLRITDIDDNGRFIKDNLSSVDDLNSGKYYLKTNEIVFAKTGASVGKTYLYNKKDGDLVFAGFLIRTKINTDKAHSKFIFYNTQTKFYQNWIIANSMRSGQPGINSNEIKSLQIPLPPLAEQEAIASALSDADAWIESLEQLIAKKRLIKQGAMQTLLTPPSTLRQAQGSSRTEDAEPVEAWEVKKLGEVVNFKNGAAHEKVVDENGEFVIVNSKFISQEGRVRKFSNAFLCPLYKNEIVMVMSDIPNGKALAKCFIIDKDNTYTLNQRICAFEAKDGFDAKYLFYKINRNLSSTNKCNSN
ncbi:restriction endonuclease subunit S [Empedobacter falsenii]